MINYPLHKLSTENLQLLFDQLQDSSINSLRLHYVFFEDLSDDQWNLFLENLKTSKFTAIELHGNLLENITSERKHGLFNCLKDTQIISIKFKLNTLKELKQEEWQLLLDWLKSSRVVEFLVEDEILDEGLSQEIKSILEHNRKVRYGLSSLKELSLYTICKEKIVDAELTESENGLDFKIQTGNSSIETHLEIDIKGPFLKP